MNAVIRERVKVDARHAIFFSDLRLIPGQEVEIIVSSPVPDAANTEPQSLWQLSKTQSLDAPADYSVNFDAAQILQ